MTYIQAVMLRTVAEQKQEADAYELAAKAFDELGMRQAAERCRERAKHYRTGETDDEDTSEDRRQYITGEYARQSTGDIINH